MPVSARPRAGFLIFCALLSLVLTRTSPAFRSCSERKRQQLQGEIVMNEATEPNSGGAAPADRQCQYTKSDGKRCRNWILHGRDHCFAHDRYIHASPERPIDVPLLEDEPSIVYVLSQTLQCLAWGTVPIANGRMILDGCHFAHKMQMQHLETAKFRLKLRRLNIPEHEIFGEAPDTPALAPQTPIPAASEHAQELDARRPDPDPTPNPVKERPGYIQFRDLKKDWDKDMLRVENEMTDMSHRRFGETQEDFLASHARPFDHLAAVDLEVQRAREMAAALTAKNESPTVNN
jgi:hypothetical protein